MKKQTLVMMGLCGVMMTSVLLGNPGSNAPEQGINAIVARPNSPTFKAATANLSDLERGAILETIKTQDTIDTLSWRAKAIGLVAGTSMGAMLAIYVRLS